MASNPSSESDDVFACSVASCCCVVPSACSAFLVGGSSRSATKTKIPCYLSQQRIRIRQQQRAHVHQSDDLLCSAAVLLSLLSLLSLPKFRSSVAYYLQLMQEAGAAHLRPLVLIRP